MTHSGRPPSPGVYQFADILRVQPRGPVGKTAAKRKSFPMFGWASLLSCSRLQYALIGSDGSLFMNVTANIGTVAHAGTARTWAPAALACMGIVFGDIGTSPLYALSATAKAVSPAGDVSPQAVLGIVSLIFWSLIIVICIKYAILIMRADNQGEGGILALLALISPRRAKQSRRRAIMVVIGLVGAALLYGDGTITPAISVLSAIEASRCTPRRWTVPSCRSRWLFSACCS